MSAGLSVADAAHRGVDGLAAADDHQFFLGADDHVDLADDRLEPPRYRLGADVAILSGVMTGEAPEVRAVVHVEQNLAAGRLGDPHRLAARRLDAGRGEMRAGDHDRTRRSDEGRVDLVLDQAHIGAIGPIEDVRLVLVVAHAEQHQRRQPMRVGDHAIQRHALASELFADEAAHLLVADARDQPGLQSQARRADRHVGRAAAHRFGERADILKPPADLLAVEIHGRATDRDHVETVGRGHQEAFDFLAGPAWPSKGN